MPVDIRVQFVMAMNLFDLTGKTAIVTGGAGHIGKSLSAGLAEHGATVIVVDTDEVAGQRVADEIPGNAEHRSTDITSESEVKELMDSVMNDHSSLDILVNAALPRAENSGQAYEEISIETWRKNVDLHLNSYFLTSYTASVRMKNQDEGGSIINLGSIYGFQGLDFDIYKYSDVPASGDYFAIKGGVINMTRYLATYLAQFDVRANIISPGGVFDEEMNTSFVEEYEKNTPLNRMAEPDDFKGPVVFLSSEASSYVTGENLVVDGGWTIK